MITSFVNLDGLKGIHMTMIVCGRGPITVSVFLTHQTNFYLATMLSHCLVVFHSSFVMETKQNQNLHTTTKLFKTNLTITEIVKHT